MHLSELKQLHVSQLMDMATHNLAMRNLMFEFKDLGLAIVGKVKGGNRRTLD